MRKKYEAYGLWRVTTEGDCEGKSTTDLGFHEGFIDDIAFALGAQAYYSLTFHAVSPEGKPKQPKPVDSVTVTLDIDSGTWPGDMTPAQRIVAISEILKDRPVVVTGSQYYASVVLMRDRRAAPPSPSHKERRLSRSRG